MENCIFCQIAEGKVPSIRVHEDKDFIVFMDINPITKGHCLIVPRNHHETLNEMPDTLLAKALPLAKALGEAIKKTVGAKGYNLLQNNGAEAGQVVFHWHLHIIPRNNKSEFPFTEGTPADVTKLPFIANDIRNNFNL